VPLSVRFGGTGSYDPDGSIRQYHWGFGDGAEAAGLRVEHTYETGGTYETCLTVTDRRQGLRIR